MVARARSCLLNTWPLVFVILLSAPGDTTTRAGDSIAKRNAHTTEYATYFPEDAFAAVVVRPQAHRFAALAFGMSVKPFASTFGIDPQTIERFAVCFVNSAEGRPLPHVRVFELTTPVEIGSLAAKSSRYRTEKATYAGKTYLRLIVPDQRESHPVLYQMNDRSFVVSTESLLKKSLSGSAPRGAIAQRLSKMADVDGVAVVTLDGPGAARAVIESWIAGKHYPAPFADVESLAGDIVTATLTLDLDDRQPLVLELEASSEEAGRRLERLALAERARLLSVGKLLSARLAEIMPPLAELVDETLTGLRVVREDDRVRAAVEYDGGAEWLARTTESIDVALQSDLRRRRERDQLGKIGLALHEFHDKNRALPPAKHAAWRTTEGILKMSWRVYLLPYVGEERLFESLKPDEPWNSPHNRSILEQADNPFLTIDDDASSKKTRFRTFSGKRTFLRGGDGIQYRNVRDGTSNTLLAIRVAPDKAVPWYESETAIPIDTPDLRKAFGDPGPRGYQALFFDGRVRWLKPDISNEVLRALITIDGTDFVDPKDYLQESPVIVFEHLERMFQMRERRSGLFD